MTIRIRKLANRSGKQKCQICGDQQILCTHHILGRKIYKPNHKDNLVNCCDNCHRKVHAGRIKIMGWYQATNGRELLYEYT